MIGSYGGSNRKIEGSVEAFNECLDFSVDRIPASGLHTVWFTSWQASVSEVEPEILTLLASKCQDL